MPIVFLKIAWRNILRNRKRSLITISAVSIGLGGLIFLWSFVDGAHYQMVENFTDYLPGHLQVHRKGFQLKKSLTLLTDQTPSLEAIVDETHGVRACSKRIETVGLLSSPAATASAMIIAIDPEAERRVTKIEKMIQEGRALEAGDQRQVVVGSDLARKLEVAVGDKVVLMTEGVDGSLAGEAFRVVGIFRSGSEFMDAWVVYAPLPVFQEMVAAGSGITNIAIKTDDRRELVSIAASIASRLPAGYETLTWREISPMTAQWIEFDNVFIFIIVLIVLVVVAAGILNTLLMSIMERLREFGVMLALGTTGPQIGTIVLLESLCLGIVGIGVGIFLGIVVTKFYHHYGIDLSRFTKAFGNFYVGSIVYPRLSFRHMLLSCLIIFLSSVVVSFYPAWRAQKLEPVEAMNRA